MRFCVYQINRIIILRQSSQSHDMTEKFSNLKHMSMTSYSTVISYWKFPPSDIGVYWEISEVVAKTASMWEEAIVDNPNSTRFLEGYAWFLLEANTKFSEALLQIHKKEMIEKGFSFMKDYAFRSLVYNFPFYLRKKLLDVQGHFITDPKHTKVTDASHSSNMSSITT